MDVVVGQHLGILVAYETEEPGSSYHFCATFLPAFSVESTIATVLYASKQNNEEKSTAEVR